MNFDFVCDNIKYLRKSLNLSQAEFGKAIDMSNKRVSSIETYAIVPTLINIFAICHAYDISILELLEG